MSITLRQVYNAAAGSVSGVAVQPNDLILVMFYGYNAGNDDDPPSDGSNTYTKVRYYSTTVDGGAPVRLGMYWAKAVGAATLTVNVPASFSSHPKIIVHVYYGQDLTAPVDSSMTFKDAGATTNHVTGNLTLAATGMMVALWAHAGVTSVDTGADSWTLQVNQTSEGFFAVDSLDKVYAAPGDYTASMTSTVTKIYAAIFAGFKGALVGNTGNMFMVL